MSDDKITIRLTDARPVRVSNANWPLIASAKGDSWTEQDPARHQQALQCGELDKYSIGVRQHADGRTIIYGFVSGSPLTGTKDAYAGFRYGLVGESVPDATSTASIRRVAGVCGIPSSVADECIADLEPEDLD